MRESRVLNPQNRPAPAARVLGPATDSVAKCVAASRRLPFTFNFQPWYTQLRVDLVHNGDSCEQRRVRDGARLNPVTACESDE